MNRFLRILEKITDASGVFCLLIMLGVLLLQIFCRYVLHNALAFPEEVARFTFLWAAFAGISVSLKKKAHLRIEILPTLMPKSGTKFLNFACEILNVAFFLFFIAISYQMMLEIKEMDIKGVAVPIHLWIVWLGLPLYGTLSAIFSFGNILNMLMSGSNEADI